MGPRLCNFLASFLFVALIHTLVPGSFNSAHAACGADGQSACTTTAASKSSTKPFCPSGAFPDPRNGGECWSCPGGYTRSGAAVTASNACYIPAGEKLSSASRHQKTPWAWDCKGGRFWDGYQGGYCWSCPGGYNRTGNHIKGGNACSASVPEKRSTATYRSKIGCPGGTAFDPRNNGECWSCPPGYNRNANAVTGGAACTAQSACNSGLKLISGKCVSTDASGRPTTCGHLNQRPCTVTEFLPSCDKDLTELGGKGKCITDTIVKDAMAGAAKFAADAARKFDEGVNGATRAAAKLAANNAVRKFNPFLRDLKKRMDGFGANEKAALDRIVKTIRSGKVDRQAQQDMRMIGAKLGLLAGQAGAIVPDNVKHSSFGVFFQDSAAAVVGVAAGYSM
ncbi:MAG: hypothetical protein K9J42_10875, partial [Sulfuritalea sp.]|nr:hypothetical protein [Sulfuritalea sp.]